MAADRRRTRTLLRYLAVAGLAGLAAARTTAAGDLAGTVTGMAGAEGAVIYLEGVPGSFPPRAVRHAISQKRMRFAPPVLPILAGETVDFPNDDLVIYHNVFSRARRNRFDLGTYRQGEARSFTFAEPEVVEVLCRIHTRMYAVVLVLSNPYYAGVDADGRYAIRGVPAGRFTAHVLVSRRQTVAERTAVVSLPASGEVLLDWDVEDLHAPTQR
ncbi:MAG: hypothetical protein AB1505_26870 [Candidatus Latescibacterota bacterium]